MSDNPPVSANPPPRRNPFAVEGRTDTAEPDAPPAPRGFARSRAAKLAGLAILLILGLWCWRRSAPADSAASATALAPRDQAKVLAGRLWGDLEQTAKVAGLYREIYWRTANDDERLLVACKYGELELVKALVNSGANVNHADRPAAARRAVEWPGATPLLLAAGRGRQDLVEFLLDHGADVNGRDDRGETALYGAVQAGQEDLALFLLAHGADPNAASLRTNATPLGLAFGANQTRVVDALRERGGHF